MKKLLITSLAFAGVCASAAAQETSIEVVVPANVTEPSTAEAYNAELTDAIKQVCRKAASPVIGIAYYTMLDCIERTTDKVAAEEPTGLFAAAKSQPKPVVLADQSVR